MKTDEINLLATSLKDKGGKKNTNKAMFPL